MTEILQCFLKSLSKSQVPNQALQSSIAMILKQTPNNGLDMLFIKRSTSFKDKHSGQIAFPGGKLEKNEKSLDGAIRESFEEIGIDLEKCEYLGHNGLTLAYQGGLRVNSMMLTSHVFFTRTDPFLRLNPGEISSYRWVDFSVFTQNLAKYVKGKRNSATDPSFKTLCNPGGFISGEFPGVLLPKSSYCSSPDYSEFHLWGASYRKLRELVSLLPPSLLKTHAKDWVFYDLDWPHKLLTPYITFLDTYFPEKLSTTHFIL